MTKGMWVRVKGSSSVWKSLGQKGRKFVGQPQTSSHSVLHYHSLVAGNSGTVIKNYTINKETNSMFFIIKKPTEYNEEVIFM